MDLGNGFTIMAYEAAVQDLRNKLNDYNTTLSTVDEKRSMVFASEKKLKDFSERMLTGVAPSMARTLTST